MGLGGWIFDPTGTWELILRAFIYTYDVGWGIFLFLAQGQK